jgi:hypothetical protein
MSIQTALFSGKGKGRESIKEEDTESDDEGRAEPSGTQDPDPGGPAGPGTATAAARRPDPPDPPHRIPKIPAPTPFSGKREDWIPFIMQVSRYFGSYEEFFAMDHVKAVWFLQWFEGEAPKQWATALILSVGNADEHPGMRNWSILLQEATSMWGPIAPQEDAARRMRNLRQWGSVADYHARFIAYTVTAGYNDLAQADLFYTGLRDGIKDLMLGVQRPKTLQGMLEMALTFEARILTRASEKRIDGGKFQKTSAKMVKLSPGDLAKHRKAGTCFECGKTGHIAKNCFRRKPKPTQANKVDTKEEETLEPKEEIKEEDFLED